MKVKKYQELDRLKKLLQKKNLSYRKLAKLIAMSTDALNNKLNGYSVFKSNEVERLAEILHLAPEEINYYFFPSCCVSQQKEQGETVVLPEILLLSERMRIF